MQIDANMNSNVFYHNGYTSISSSSAKTSILVSSGYGTKDIVRSNDVHVEQREEVRQKPTIIRKEDVTELQKNLEKITRSKKWYSWSNFKHSTPERSWFYADASSPKFRTIKHSE